MTVTDEASSPASEGSTAAGPGRPGGAGEPARSRGPVSPAWLVALMAAEPAPRLAGLHALDSCRLEKGFRHWGHDITDEDDPLQAGLGFALAWDKPGGFIGREALLARRSAEGFGRRRLVAIRLEDPNVFLHREEPILEDGRILGSVTSGAFGHRLEASLGLGWIELDGPVTAERLSAGRFAVEVAGEPVPATLSPRPFYDPEGRRVRG